MSVSPLTVVGIGASAGGLDAFRRFFAALPSDSGMAFVVVLHLPANRRSMLPEIIGRWTEMPVVEAADGVLIEADHVYVPPPQARITIDEGRLRVRLAAANAERDQRPIDGFFDSLAANLRESAVGIVLSGTGTDGALGLKAIKDAGGLTLAQGTDGSGPQFEGMPHGAIATGAVDLIASVEDMPGHLIRLQRNPAIAAPDDDGDVTEDSEAVRARICASLRAQVGHDFSNYKDKTFLRRVQRRMQVVALESMSEYADRLEHDHDEAVLLFRDLLIRVTSFFRDTETFATLKRVAIPRLFENRRADATVRLWVPGCATGEETYSLAMLLCEHMDELRWPPRVQLFGTDLDDAAITAARAGRYPATLLRGLSDERRRRFFHETDSGFVVAKEIREICTFSPHNLVRDPPFSRMDLISCRNLLIYLNADAQAQVIPAFHYSLVPGGILLLGSSESTARHDDLFEPLDLGARIFVRRNTRTPLFHLVTERRGPPLGAGEDSSRSSGVDPDAAGRRTLVGARDPATGPRTTPARGAGAGRGPGGSGGLGVLPGMAADALRRLLSPSDVARTLRDQLERTENELQSIREDHETALEELRSTNEELHSVNEEIQSTNEELETSKEEIQSVNEELQTVNAQLQEKVEELNRSNSDLKNLFESTDVATVFLDRDLLIRSFTPAVATIYNLIPSDQGRPLTDIVSSLNYTTLRSDVREVLTTLTPLERPVTHRGGDAHYALRIVPYRGLDSQVDGVLVTFIDVTSVVRAEQQRLIVDELNHRVKNMLTMVVSIAQQTLRRSDSMEQFAEAFMGRVQALTGFYALLLRQNWVAVTLADVVMEEAAPFVEGDAGRLVVHGPETWLGPPAALAFGMLVHELVTNAVKYGALSTPGGTVAIDWRFQTAAGPPELVLDWVERGGPPVVEPTRSGFGMTLLQRSFAHEMSGEATVEFHPQGVRARLRTPLGISISASQDGLGARAPGPAR